MKIISKIESQCGVDNLDEIINASDAIMVARGDLGVEVPMEQLPELQKRMIKKAVTKGKAVITATEMLESMINNKRPTRAEVTDIANAVYLNDENELKQEITKQSHCFDKSEKGSCRGYTLCSGIDRGLCFYFDAL